MTPSTLVVVADRGSLKAYKVNETPNRGASLQLVQAFNIMDAHGPLLVFASVLILAGVQLLALGLLGEMQVRHYYAPAQRAPYSVAEVLRSSENQSAVS